ncbi:MULTISPECIES: carbohydrate binding domain-containing protein [unclassified Agarivorans]|uniref:carbohydrate binding domain-containing protein n=1 Tax=unclassified Agarivorans TaxID=2636026 RepID=UPI0026E1AB2F|nr:MULTISPECIES: carbohydrate binding domain-containing protein [unclassified Agarivorans]MDO6683940.1 carbohydrate binding domain-containing protein [Agarivorans sp. 3_MG-2023]MDO6714327.1 carbohydrate binding domain-containing protein [Agarivorans sp. 2_MG-2023]
MLKQPSLLLCGLVISLLAGNVYAARVKVINADFEQGWYGWKKSGPSAISDHGRDDESSAKITGESGRVEQDVRVKPNTDYTLMAFMKGSGQIGVNTVAELTEKQKAVNKFQTLTMKTYSDDDYHPDWEKITVDFNSGNSDTVTIFAAYEDGTGRFDRFRVIRARK